MTGASSGVDAQVQTVGARIEAASAAVGQRVAWDWPEVLVRRADPKVAPPGGRTSVGGATRLLACLDGWVAVSLARSSDHDLVPAWLALAGGDPAATTLEAGVAARKGADLAAAAEVVGLPVGVLGERAADPAGGVTVRDAGPAAPRSGGLRVVDLSALWAGPLVGAILAEAGAVVTKVESSARPDASRDGDPALHRRLNGAKAERSVDLSSSAGRSALAALVRGADVVVESARPRALEQLGIVAAAELARPDGPQVWVSITGHGRGSSRVAFGDDAAVAGGLVEHTDQGPGFFGDAIADPLTGLAAAATALEVLAAGRRALVDAALAGVAASAAS